MKNILISFLILFSFMISCKGQDKDGKKQEKAITYYAKCEGEYSNGEKLNEKDKTWSLNKADIDKIINLSNPITEDEWHFSYPITPCNIDVKDYLYKGKKYDLQINGGSYVSLYDGKETLLLGCDSPECKKYFLKSKENMQEEEVTYPPSNSTKSEQIRKYNISFNKNDKQDILTVQKTADGYNLEAKANNKILFSKKFVCDFIDIETNTKNNQTFNLILGYTDQYQNVFRKIVIPVFFRNNDLFIEKLFISSLGTSAKTGEEEWIRKEVSEKSSLKQLELDKVLLQ